MKKYIALFTVLSSFTAMASSPGTVGFQYLKTHTAARPAAMGGAFVAVSADVNALYYNPAGIANIVKRTASFTYLNDLLDFNTGFIALVEPEFGPGNLGVSILFKDYGRFKRTDGTGQEIGDFTSNAISLAGSYSLRPFQNLMLGVTAKYLRFAIDTYSADAIAVDAGFMYYIPVHKLTFAAELFNVGKTLTAFVASRDDLPTQFKAGFAKELAHLPLLISLNLYKYNDENWHGALGGEFTLTPHVFLRLGYDEFGRNLKVDSSGDRFAGAAIGLGMVWNNLQIDYSFTSHGELGSLNRFTISGQF